MRVGFAHQWKRWAILTVSGCLWISNAQELSELDTDRDGLSDHIELTVTLTDTNRADTDGDGVSDFEEVENESLDRTALGKHVASICAGGTFGELALSSDEKNGVGRRSASVIADGPVQLIRLSSRSFAPFRQKHREKVRYALLST